MHERLTVDHTRGGPRPGKRPSRIREQVEDESGTDSERDHERGGESESTCGRHERDRREQRAVNDESRLSLAGWSSRGGFNLARTSARDRASFARMASDRHRTLARKQTPHHYYLCIPLCNLYSDTSHPSVRPSAASSQGLAPRASGLQRMAHPVVGGKGLPPVVAAPVYVPSSPGASSVSDYPQPRAPRYTATTAGPPPDLTVRIQLKARYLRIQSKYNRSIEVRAHLPGVSLPRPLPPPFSPASPPRNARPRTGRELIAARSPGPERPGDRTRGEGSDSATVTGRSRVRPLSRVPSPPQRTHPLTSLVTVTKQPDH